MIALIQRVAHARVDVAGETVGQIGSGLLVLLGVQRDDDEATADKLLHKVSHYRIFPDADGKMNLNVQQAGGSLLVVSQFTLLGDARKGNRPSFIEAAAPEEANALYLSVCDLLRAKGHPVATGVFRADMQVELVNDGPVTFILER